MKRFTFFSALIFMAFAFVSCGDDDTDTNVEATTADLVGTWEMTAFETDLEGSFQIEDQQIDFTSSSVGKDFDYQVIFGAEGNLSATGSYTLETTTTSLGQTQTQEDVIADDGFFEGTYSVSGSTITFTDASDSMTTATIQSLTDTRMVLRANLDDATELEGIDLFDGSFEGQSTIVLERAQ